MSTSATEHEKFVRRAIKLSAKAALEYGTGGAFGAVITKDGKIISEGMNRVVASHDPTWHGEISSNASSSSRTEPAESPEFQCAKYSGPSTTSGCQPVAVSMSTNPPH